MLDAFSQTESSPTFFDILYTKSFVSILHFSGFVFGAFLSIASSYCLKLVWKLLWEVWIFATLKWDTTWSLNLNNMENMETEFVPVALFRDSLPVLSAVCWDCGLGLSAAIIKKDDLGLMDAIEATFVLAVFSCFSSDRVILAHFLRTTLLHDAVTVWATVLRKRISSVRGAWGWIEYSCNLREDIRTV